MKPQTPANTPSGDAYVHEYGRYQWVYKNGRHPRLHQNIVVPENPFDIFEMEEARAARIIESGFYVVRKADLTKVYHVPYSQAVSLRHVATAYSLYLWVALNRQLPALHADNKIERGMAIFVESLGRQPTEFRKLQCTNGEPELHKLAASLTEEHTRRREGLRSMLTAALAGYSQRELHIFNRYHFAADKMNALFDPDAHHQVSDEQWAYLLGEVTAEAFRKIVDKMKHLVHQHVIVLDQTINRFAPRQPVTLDLRA